MNTAHRDAQSVPRPLLEQSLAVENLLASHHGQSMLVPLDYGNDQGSCALLVHFQYSYN